MGAPDIKTICWALYLGPFLGHLDPFSSSSFLFNIDIKPEREGANGKCHPCVGVAEVHWRSEFFLGPWLGVRPPLPHVRGHGKFCQVIMVYTKTNTVLNWD